MNYAEEAEQLKDAGNWFKPEEGKQILVILEDLTALVKKPFTDKETGVVKELEQSELIIEHKKERKTWSITKSAGKNSLWGQLIRLGKAKGKLSGQTITLLMKGKGRSKDYTIVEALQLDEKVENK